MSQKALEGIKIADFSWVIAGPAITASLASYGATVIRIESIKRPELLRTAPPFRDRKPGINRSGGFVMNNNNKYGVTLNLNHAKGLEIARKIINWADIVVENFTPGTMKKWNLSYDDIIKFRPDIIMLSTCMQGQYGPRAAHPGFGGQLTSLCGFTHLCGWPDRIAVRPSSGYTDVIGPRFGVAALVAALIYRLKQGKGHYFDLSQYEAGIQFLAPTIMDYMVNGRIANRNGNRHPFWSPHGAYPCKGEDKWCVIAVSSDEEWNSLCRVLDAPSLAEDRRFQTFKDRKKNEDFLNSIIGEWTSKFNADHVMRTMQKAGVPAGIVQNSKEHHSDLQLKHRGHFKKVKHPEIGEYTAYLPGFRLSKTPPKIEMPAPCIGEHNYHVYTKILGISDEKFVEYLEDGVFE